MSDIIAEKRKAMKDSLAQEVKALRIEITQLGETAEELRALIRADRAKIIDLPCGGPATARARVLIMARKVRRGESLIDDEPEPVPMRRQRVVMVRRRRNVKVLVTRR